MIRLWNKNIFILQVSFFFSKNIFSYFWVVGFFFCVCLFFWGVIHPPQHQTLWAWCWDPQRSVHQSKKVWMPQGENIKFREISGGFAWFMSCRRPHVSNRGGGVDRLDWRSRRSSGRMHWANQVEKRVSKPLLLTFSFSMSFSSSFLFSSSNTSVSLFSFFLTSFMLKPLHPQRRTWQSCQQGGGVVSQKKIIKWQVKWSWMKQIITPILWIHRVFY